MKNSKISKKYVINSAVTFFAVTFALLNYQGTFKFHVSCLIIAISLFSALRVRKNIYLFIIYSFIAYCSYSVVITMYMFGPIDSFFASYVNQPSGILGLNILSLFTLGLFLITPKISPKKPISFTTSNKYNPLIALGAIIVLIFVFMYSYKRPEVIGERGGGSPFYEYSIVINILGIYYMGKNKLLKSALILISLIYALNEFIFGGRVTGLQYIIVMFLCIEVDKISLRVVIPLGFIVAAIMFSIGSLRGGVALNNSVIDLIILGISIIFKGKFVLDTAYAAHHASLTFIETMSFTPFDTRIYMFVQWLKYLFIGSSVEDSNLTTYAGQFFQHYGGGILPYWGYFYLGAFGVILILIYLRFLFRMINDNTGHTNNGFARCITVYISASVLRWWLYSPSQITRALIMFFIVYQICNISDLIIKGAIPRFHHN